jgi:hypothetical protein
MIQIVPPVIAAAVAHQALADTQPDPFFHA